MTYADWLKSAVETLTKCGVGQSAKLDAYLLLEKVTGKTRAQLIAFDDEFLTDTQLSALTALFNRRCQGEPMAYILGEKAFWSLNLDVDSSTLIPRPDTEVLVERALDLARAAIAQLNPPHFAILDLGTGTGAIALALACELQPYCQQHDCHLRVVGVDKIESAVALAKRNQQRNGIFCVEFVQSDWFHALLGQHFDLIVSNPPYIDAADPHLEQGDVRFEPRSALVAQKCGLGDIEQIIRQSPAHLNDGGYLLLEHGWQQGEAVRSQFLQQHWQHIQTIFDYAGLERVTLAGKPT
ncbi:peptide chain release factor N(5)-glutamine methyltransferase [Spirabiliibacterium pneumoniae]|uniref:peptide chain release factor N(5)-glutamine methyltransferase n=1 Tax=Spirabiliibacterium pneumoniae TaxID=221400 RepID=UPI0038B6086B